ncbi:MauE/DoxX family redox-associated membrane protein [Thalassoroseus pseudoceratinae]|uniref:MauE/DoxX family redox-associated membrane protein n=1 Tax=Thalassoroseus pseudoceratinae TaxID=2713176 RepID=UPI0014242F0C|nr:MauE/DoxX family redox-associated membrane protein [Thalassoroseus pseudoceratinae]
MNTTAEIESDSQAQTIRRLSRWVTIATAALLMVTWKLWTPQTIFPQIPFLELLTGTPGWVDWVLLFGVVGALVVTLFSPPPDRFGRLAMGVFAVCLTGLISLDQHRLQPWAWQFLLIAWLLITVPNKSGLHWCRWLTVSIYAWSAVSKLNYSFLHEHANLFLGVIADWTGTKLADWPDTVQMLAAWVFPLGELLVALLLILWPHRRIGLWASWLMHGTLIALVGPFGLQHEWGVLLWNVFFIGQNALLYPRRTGDAFGHQFIKELRPREFVASIPIVTALVLPLTSLRGWFDEWPSWAVYTGRAEQVRVEIREDVRESIPKDLPISDASTGDTLDFQPWRSVNLGRWSLETLETPIYPQSRFRLAVAAAISERLPDEFGIRVTVRSATDRKSGARWTETYRGREAIEQLLDRFWLNTQARRIWSP